MYGCFLYVDFYLQAIIHMCICYILVFIFVLLFWHIIYIMIVWLTTLLAWCLIHYWDPQQVSFNNFLFIYLLNIITEQE